MLFYLDNWESQADSNRPRLAPVPGAGRGGAGRNIRGGLLTPQQQQMLARRRGGLNENYGRELLELHTLGVDGGYTQQDVINVARAFTGWTFPRPQQGGGEFGFNPQMHDAGTKIVLGHKLAPGRGVEDGEDVLDIVSRHPSTAKYIAFKLARRFVSDTPPAELVERAARTFRRTDGDIRDVVRTIVTSPEFFSHAAYRSKVKSPFEVVVSALRALGAPPDGTLRTAQADRHARRADLRPPGSERLARDGRSVAEHGRDPQPHQLRRRDRRGTDTRRVADELEGRRVAA